MNQKNTTPTKATKPNNTPASTQANLAQTDEDKKPATTKFVEKAMRQFKKAALTEIELTPFQTRLLQHVSMAVERTLAMNEQKRQKDASGRGRWAEKAQQQTPFDWKYVNMDDLIVNALRIVEMEIDAALPNHLSVICRLNGVTGKYDVGLQPGYEGKLHFHRKCALMPPMDVPCRLVFADDIYDVVLNDAGGEEPVYKPGRRFRPADELPIGGYFHLRYNNPALNRVIDVDAYEFEKSEKAAQSDAFWGGWVQETEWRDGEKVNVGEPVWDNKVRRDMMYKTVVLRACKAIKLDPQKMSADVMLMIEAPEIDAASLEMRNERHENQSTEDLNIPPAAPLPEPKADPATGEVVEDEFAEVEDEKKVSGPAQEEL